MSTLDLKVIISAIDKTGAVMSGVGRNMDAMGKKMGAVGQQMSMYITAPIALAGGMAVKTATDFDKTMRSVRGLAEASGSSAEELDKLTDIALEFGKKGMFGPKQVAVAMEDMVRDGLEPSRIAGGHLAAVYDLATAASVSLGDAQIILSDTMAVYGAQADEAKKYSSALLAVTLETPATMLELSETMKYVGTAAVIAGMDIHELMGAVGVLADMGYRGSMAGTALARAIEELTDPSDEAREKLDELGVKIFHTDGTMRSMEDIISDLRVGMAGMNDEQKTLTINTLFDIRARRAITLLIEAQKGAIEEMEEATKNSGLTQLVAAKMAKGLSYEMAVMAAKIEVVQIELADALLPAITIVARAIGDLTDWFVKLSPEWKKMIGYAAILAAVIGPLLMVLGFLAGAISKIIMLFKILGSIKSAIIAKTALLGGALKILKGVIIAIKVIFAAATIKIWLIVGVIAALVAGVLYLRRNWETVWGVIADIVRIMVDRTMGPIRNMREGLEGIVSAARRAIEWVGRQKEAAARGVGRFIGGILPGRQMGGLITQTAPYLLHKGEYVQPAHRTGAGAISITITGNTFFGEKQAVEELGNMILRSLKGQIRF